MFLIQILLPLADNSGRRFPSASYSTVAAELTSRFGGVTSYSRSPARGLWVDDAERTVADDLVALEVMAEVVDEAWWFDYRKILEARFRQDQIVVRASPVQLL